MAIPSEKPILDLIGCIYDAALHPERWQVFLERYAEAIGAAGTLMLVHDFSNNSASVASAVRMDDAYQREYEQHYAPLNPWVNHGRHLLTPGNVVAGEAMCSVGEFRRSEFYNDYLRLIDSYHTMGGTITSEQSVASYVTSLRSAASGPFGEEEMALLRVLMPHLQRAIAVHRRLGEAETRNRLNTQVLDRLPIGVVIVDSSGHVLWMNRSAERIVGQNDGLDVTRAGLAAARPHQRRSLRQAILNAASAMVIAQQLAGGSIAMVIDRPSLRRGFSVLVTPLRSTTSLAFGPVPAAAAVFITDGEEETAASGYVLGVLFGLTAAEARLAALLMQGHSVEESADQLSVSRNTIRTHLQKLFQKTGTSRQGELVRLLLASPAALRPS